MLDFNSSYEPADDSLTSMLLKKEKELQELSKLRISQLQDQIIFKDKTIFDLESQIRRLHDDLAYNLSLMQQRDEEIADLENNISSLLSQNSAHPVHIEKLKSEINTLSIELKKSEEYIRQLQESREVCNDIQHKLQEAYSEISKLKYEEQFNAEKYKEIENNFFETKSINQQFLEEIKEKNAFLQELLNEKQNFELEKNEFKQKIKLEKEKLEREIISLRTKFGNELRQVKEGKESSVEQISFTHKLQIEKLQTQVKTLLEDNRNSNNQIEYYQNSLLHKEKELSQEIYDLKKENTYNQQYLEQLKAEIRGKDMEIQSIKEHIDHWKNLAQNRGDELFKFKQLQVRSEEKAENYLKELDLYKNESFNEILRLKKENESLLQEKKNQNSAEKEDNKKYYDMKLEIEKLNQILYNKDKEISRLGLLMEGLQKEKNKLDYEDSTNKSVKFLQSKKKLTDTRIKDFNRGNSYNLTSRNKISQVKNNLDKKFLEFH